MVMPGGFAMELEHPERLALLALAAVAWALMRWRRRGVLPAVASPTYRLFQPLPRTLAVRARHLPAVLRTIGVVLLGISLSGPVTVRTAAEQVYETTDIVFLVDSSGSMLAQDLSPSRLGAAQSFIEKVVRARPRSRFGLVTFAATTVVECPVTSDHRAFLERLRGVSHRDEEEGTALGGAIAECCRRIKTGLSEARAIVLLTDGAENSTGMSPELGARLARELGIRIHAVGLGSDAPAPYPTEFGTVSVRLAPDYRALTMIASVTAGRFFKASDSSSLDMVLHELDRMESTERRLSGRETRDDTSGWWVIAATCCLALEMLLRAMWIIGAA